jgi:hypothetical protein
MQTLDFNEAAAHYMRAVGDGALIPSRQLSAVKGGSWYLRNCNGSLAIVTSRGVVMDRIGGQRLGDQLSPNATPSEALERIAHLASAALDETAGLPPAARAARLEAALRAIGSLADSQAGALGFVPVRTYNPHPHDEWQEDYCDAPT